jgi:DNA polymerase I-like protein with 3'-5' exonuclease and polymerase domains
LLNHPVQGLNADITKLALVKLSKVLAETGAKLICTVHDEILLECPIAEAKHISYLLHPSLHGCSSSQVSVSDPSGRGHQSFS